MAAVQIEGADQIRALAATLNTAGPELRKAMAGNLRNVAKPIVAEMRAVVKADGGGSRGSGARARAAYRLSRSRSQRPSAAASAEKRSGLRATIAAATGSSATTGPDRINLTFRMKSSQLPPEQRVLGKSWNRPGGWRHPVFGRAVWVNQTGRPYFDAVIRANAPLLSAGVEAALVKTVELLQNSD